MLQLAVKRLVERESGQTNIDLSPLSNDLKTYWDEYLNKRESDRQDQLKEKAIALGCPDNLELARYVESLETQVKEMSTQLDKLGQRKKFSHLIKRSSR
ncbi:hypothetical protein ACRARQ_003854 [Yersinia enterocolitica]